MKLRLPETTRIGARGPGAEGKLPWSPRSAGTSLARALRAAQLEAVRPHRQFRSSRPLRGSGRWPRPPSHHHRAHERHRSLASHPPGPSGSSRSCRAPALVPPSLEVLVRPRSSPGPVRHHSRRAHLFLRVFDLHRAHRSIRVRAIFLEPNRHATPPLPVYWVWHRRPDCGGSGRTLLVHLGPRERNIRHHNLPR